MHVRLSLVGNPVDSVDLLGAVEWVERRIGQRDAPAAVFDLNPEKVCRLRQSRSYAAAFSEAGLILADGVGVTLAARLLLHAQIPRLPGIDLMSALCALAPARGWRVFLYGGSDAVNVRAAARIQGRYPGIAICGRAHGYVGADGESALIEHIRAARPDILFVGLGSPRQELWIAENLNRLGVPVCQAVGGAFDIFAGRFPRAPQVVRNCGLEWVWRLVCEPSRVRRQANLFRFASYILTAWLAGRKASVTAARSGGI